MLGPWQEQKAIPTAGVGKWFAYPPKGILTTWSPFAALSPCTAPSPQILQTSPSAMIGPLAAPSLSVQSCFRYGGLVETLTAVTPFGQGCSCERLLA
jgi:hypothetical protein